MRAKLFYKFQIGFLLAASLTAIILHFSTQCLISLLIINIDASILDIPYFCKSACNCALNEIDV